MGKLSQVLWCGWRYELQAYLALIINHLSEALSNRGEIKG
jgi:hypothetical protein